jgi:AICAR transformylase/IMP cyclohydrolase PurH
MPSYALFSVNDTQCVEIFAKCLKSLGWGIICTSKPYEKLTELGFDVILINDFVGISEYNFSFPPTLHPKVEQALTVDDPHCRIELVYNVTYDLSAGNDIGGHTLLALAVKGGRIPVQSLEDMIEVVDQINIKSKISDSYRLKLVNRANYKIMSHYYKVSREFENVDYEVLFSRKNRTLLNGENPYQVPCDLFDAETDDPLALPRFSLLTGANPCFTNMADLDCVIETMCKLSMGFEKNKREIPYITVAAKHGNACGIGIDWTSPDRSVTKALWGNPLAVWGGELMVNFHITAEIATQLFSSEKRESELGTKNWMLDVIVAPSVDPEGEEVFRQRKNTKLFTNPALAGSVTPTPITNYRQVRGGLLKQPGFSYILDLKTVKLVGRELNALDIDSAIIAWAASFTSSHGGNEVAIAAQGFLLGIGGGPSTVDAAKIAIERSALYHENFLDGSIFAADAFFPFEDAPRLLSRAGCKGGIVPAGGIREKEIVEFFKNNNITVAFLDKKIRGFCRH